MKTKQIKTNQTKYLLSALLIFLSVLFLSITSSNAQNFSKLDTWLEDNVSDMGGRAVLLIYKDGKIVYNHSVNDMSWKQKLGAKFFAKKRNKEPNLEDFTDTSKQAIASCSKWLSAALVMTFVDEGKLRLDDTIGKFLPIMSNNGKGNITISQCLSHTTAIKSLDLKESLQEMKEIHSMDQAVEKIAQLEMEGKPGKVFHYSNVGLQLAAAVIEKISNKSFKTLFDERIAKVLEMKNTDFGNGEVPLPAGGALSTPKDYLNFLIMISNKGVFKGKRVLSEESIRQMQINRITNDVKIAYSPAEAGSLGYGFGEWIMQISDSNNITRTVSSPGLFGSFPWIDNDKKYCAFMMCMSIKSKGRGEIYKELKKLIDEIIN